MKNLLILIVLFLNLSVSADNRIVDEGTVASWGYRTVSLEKNQFIKRLTKVPGEEEVYYPRFYLYKECFESNEIAKEREFEIRKLQKESVVHRDKDYRRGIVKDRCVYFISTDSNYFRLEFQPEMMRLYKQYLDSKNGV